MIQLYENLYQGNALDFEMHGSKFDAVLCCVAGESDITLSWDSPRFYLYLKSPDGTGFNEYTMKMAMDFLLSTHGHGYKTLIHCFAGMSRSVCIAACYVAALNNESMKVTLLTIHSLKRNGGEEITIYPSNAVFDTARTFLDNNRDELLSTYQSLKGDRGEIKKKQIYRIPKFGDVNKHELDFMNDKFIEEVLGGKT